MSEPILPSTRYDDGYLLAGVGPRVDLYTHPLQVNKFNPDRNYHRIVNFEPQPLLATGTEKLTYNDFLKWKQKYPNHPEIKYGYENWRILSAEGAGLNAEGRSINALNDIYRTGAVRGSLGYKGQAYYYAGFPDEIYRSTGLFVNGEKIGVQTGMYAGAANPTTKNLYITATPEYMANVANGKHPLYTSVRDRGFFGVGEVKNGVYDDRIASHYFDDLAKTMKDFDPNTTSFSGGIVAVQPSKNAGFLDRVNPMNKRGLRIMQTDSIPLAEDSFAYRKVGPVSAEALEDFRHVGNDVYVPKYASGPVPRGLVQLPAGVGPFNEKVLYDGITPFWQRTLGQHARNATFNAKSLYVQPEVQSAIAAGTKAGGVATFLIDTPELMYRQNKERLKANSEKGTYADATPLEVAKMLGYGVAGSVANALTMGAAFAGTGDARPNRGPARMEDSGNEASRRRKERADNWVPR
jgi:hypothetical protein